MYWEKDRFVNTLSVMTALFWGGVKSKLVHSINIMLGSFSVDLNQKQLSEDRN